jgi:tRNA(Arg) A34 adenosine deaminase TadA
MPKKWTDEQCDKIAFGVSAYHQTRRENSDVALVDDDYNGGRVHYVNCAAPAGKIPHSATTRLIQTLISSNRSACLAKNTIYTTSPPTAMCRGMAFNLDVSVKQVTARAALTLDDGQYAQVGWQSWLRQREQGLGVYSCGGGGSAPGLDLTSEQRVAKHQGYHTVHRIYMMVACALITRRFTQGHELLPGQNIGAILVSKQGEILAWGVNTNQTNQTYHAEVNMIQSYAARLGAGFTGLPVDCRIYTTLKPCRMCAGMIMQTAADPGRFKVFFEQSDPSTYATGTALDGNLARQSCIFSGNDVRDIVGVETDASRTRNSAPAMSSQLTDEYRRTRESRRVTSDEKRITAFLGEQFATTLFSAATQTLKGKMKKHGVGVPTAVATKDLNPAVTNALTHIRGFLIARGIAV